MGRRGFSKFRRKLLSLGLSQSAVADRLGVTRSAVSMWATGHLFPSPPVARRLARLLGISTDELIDLLRPDAAEAAEAAAAAV